MPLLDHFHPPLSDRRKWHSFHHAWATVIAFELNHQLPPGYFADPTVQFGKLMTDVVEIAIYNSEAGPVLIGAIELVSPANKDRATHRDAFVSKCASYLQQAIGLIVVDVVTDRKADLHAELLTRLGGSAGGASDLWAAAYRPWRENQETRLEIWHEPLAVASPLPALPLWLKNGPSMKIDFEATYMRTCQEQRMLPTANGQASASG